MKPDEGNQTRQDVEIPIGPISLEGELVTPSGAAGIVLFAHGSGSSRHSPRNQYVAEIFRKARLGTLLFDLLTRDEEAIDLRTRYLRFDIGLLALRLIEATRWLTRQSETSDLRYGYFGASTGGGAALVSAAHLSDLVSAVVSRGGRPDLAGSALASVRTPTLLIVGELDIPVIAMNQDALAQLNCEKKLTIVPGATHLFEEPGTLDLVARLATDWYQQHFRTRSSAAQGCKYA